MEAYHLRVNICVGRKKVLLEVTNHTTIEELAHKVCREVLEEEYPVLEEGLTLCSLLRFIYRGRTLTSPDITMGALRIKDNEKIMVLQSKRFSQAMNNKAEPQPEPQPPSIDQHSNITRNNNFHPALRGLEKYSSDASTFEQKVKQLEDNISSLQYAPPSQRKQVSQQLSGHITLYNEEHMKLLLNLDAVETNGDPRVRSDRKALVVRLQQSMKELDRLKSQLAAVGDN